MSQLHARAIRRLRDALGAMGPAEVGEIKSALVAFAKKPAMAKVAPAPAAQHGVVLPYNPDHKRRMPAHAAGPIKISRPREAVAAAR